jgi:hypothetical protein
MKGAAAYYRGAQICHGLAGRYVEAGEPRSMHNDVQKVR